MPESGFDFHFPASSEIDQNSAFCLISGHKDMAHFVPGCDFCIFFKKIAQVGAKGAGLRYRASSLVVTSLPSYMYLRPNSSVLPTASISTVSPLT